jgi:hypothetical protein
MKQLLFILILSAGFYDCISQTINISAVGVTGRFNTCTGSNTPTITATRLSTSGGSSVTGGSFTCLNSCDSSTIRVNISNIRWNRNPNLEWLHSLHLPASAGFSVSPISIPSGFITYNLGCTGTCPSGSGINGGPGFYFDNTSGNSCCTGTTVNDGVPCNNWGDVTISCLASLSITFDITFCNSLITSSSYQFVLRGSSDGETGCYNFNDGLVHSITFTIPTIPCTPSNLNLVASTPNRTCVGATENYTSTLTGTCLANNINWWSAATGGTLLGTGSPFVYDPAGSACPAGTTLYATCCSGTSTKCLSRTPVTIPGPCNSLGISGVTSTNTSCFVLGSINSVNVTNAQGAVSYSLNPGGVTNTTGIFTGLSQTAYTVTATDGGACTGSSVVNIAQPPLITFSPPVITNVTCSAPSGGQITISTTGGTGALSYSINPIATQSPPGTFSGLTAQTYTITATDITSCSTSTIVTLSPPPIPTWNSFNKVDITCAGLNNGSISAIATGGTGSFIYNLLPTSLSNSTGTFNSLTPQTYTVIAVDAFGCSVSSVSVMINPTPLNWSPIITTGTTCSYLNNGTLNILATGGTSSIQYQLLPIGTTNTSGIFNSLAAGTYTIGATDANNCSISSLVSIAQAPPINLSTPSFTSPLCNGGNGSITTMASGGTGILLYTLNPISTSNNSGIFNSILAGSYTLTVSDNNSCSTSSSVVVTEPTAITFPTVTVVDLQCTGVATGSITIIATGGTGSKSYTIQPGSITNSTGVFNSLSSQNYTVIATDANLCSKSTVVFVAQPAPIFWASTGKSNVLCNGGNTGIINVSASGGTGAINYTLLPGTVNSTGTFNTLTANTYTIKATDANGCSKTTVMTITQPTQLVWTTTTKTNVSCNGGTNGSH